MCLYTCWWYIKPHPNNKKRGKYKTKLLEICGYSRQRHVIKQRKNVYLALHQILMLACKNMFNGKIVSVCRKLLEYKFLLLHLMIGNVRTIVYNIPKAPG